MDHDPEHAILNMEPPPQEPPEEVTRLLGDIEAGDERARDRLFELVYDELRGIASRLMRQQQPAHTLQPTALVHEAALRMLNSEALARLSGRAHLLAVMARAMRQILVDHARRRKAQRRGGDQQRVPFDVALDHLEQTNRLDLLELEDGLGRLAELSQRQSDVVTLRFFGGLEFQEIAESLGVSISTVERDWRIARAWLRGQIDAP